MVILALAVLWIAVLLPSFLRNRSEGRVTDSVGDFHRHLGVLRRTGPTPLVAPAHRLRPNGGFGQISSMISARGFGFNRKTPPSVPGRVNQQVAGAPATYSGITFIGNAARAQQDNGTQIPSFPAPDISLTSNIWGRPNGDYDAAYPDGIGPDSYGYASSQEPSGLEGNVVAARLGARDGGPAYSRSAGSGPRLRTSQATLQRRKNVLVGLLASMTASFLISFAFGIALLGYLGVLSMFALGGYVFLLVQMKNRTAERAMKVSSIRRFEPGEIVPQVAQRHPSSVLRTSVGS